MGKTATPFLSHGKPIEVPEAERLDLERQGVTFPKATKAAADDKGDDTKKEGPR